MKPLTQRRLEPELMDDPALDGAEHRRALAGLARINRLSRAAAPIWRAVLALGGDDHRPLRLLDVATGSADVLVALYHRAARRRVQLDLTACDISPVALAATRERLDRAGAAARLVNADAARGLPLPDRAVDVACCSLFLHHLEAASAVSVLTEMARVSSLGIVAADLRRCAAGTLAARVVPRLLTRSRVVHVDAVLSARAAWTEEELLELAARAGLAGATVLRTFPWRMTLLWRRPVDP